MDEQTQRKWDRTSRSFDLMASRGAEQRWQPAKRELFGHMSGKILFLALGTGLDIAAFPARQRITAIDISPKMLEVAQPRIDAYDGEIKVEVMDVHELAMRMTALTRYSLPAPSALYPGRYRG